MVGYADSLTYTVYVDVTLTRCKVKVKVTGILNFRQLAKPCMLAAMTAALLRGFLVVSRDLELGGVPAVSPSRKSFFSDFNEIWFVHTGR